jgi:predicted kinase
MSPTTRWDRKAFTAGFEDAAPPLFIECRAPLDVLVDRARIRAQHEDVSDADAAVVARLAVDWEPLDEVSPERHIVIDSARPTSEVIAQINDPAESTSGRERLA